MKRLNWKFLLILVVVIAVLGVGALGAYKFQKRRSVAALLVQAKAAEKAGDHAKADGLYAHYLGFRRDDGATMADYGLMLAGDANTPAARVKAMGILGLALRLDASRADVRRELIRIEMDRTVRLYAEAFENLEALRTASPDDGRLEFQAAQCLEGERKYPEAAELYAKATDHAPDQIEAYVRLADLQRNRLDKPAEAAKVLDKMVELNPKSFRAYLERGNQRRLGRSNGADQDIARALELAPDEVDVLAAAADLAIDKNNLDEARRLTGRCLALQPKEGRSYDLSFRVEMKAGHPDEAVAALLKGIEVEQDAESRIRLMIVLVDLQVSRGKYAEAEQAIKRLESEQARPEYGKYFTARVLAGKGQWREAAKILEEIHAKPATIPEMAYDAELLLGRCSERLGEQDRRYGAFYRAVTLKPLDLRGRLGLAEALAASGRIEEAISRYRNIEDEIPKVRTNLARLVLLRNLQRPSAERDWAEVDRAMAAAEAISPSTMELQLLRAGVFADRGRLDEARNELKAAAQRFPKSDSPWIAQAELALKEGRQKVASEILDQAAQTGLGDRVGLRLARAEVLVAVGGKDAVGALDRLAEGVDRLPEEDRPTLLRGLAEAHRRVGDLAGARRILGGLVERTPDDLALRLNSFDLAYQAGDTAGMKSIIEAIGDKDEVAARLARARYLLWTASRDGQPAAAVRDMLGEARKLLGLASAQRPNWPPVVLAGAYVEDLSGNQGEAIRRYLQAIELGERGPEVATRLIAMLAGLGRNDQADRVIRKVLGGGEIKEPRFNRLAAEVALRLKDNDRALEFGAKAVDPNTATPADLLWRGRLLWAAGKAAQAEPDLRAAARLATEAEAAEAWVILVEYLVANDRRAQAEEAVEQARLKLPERGKALVLARCFAILDRRDKAREQFRAAVKAAPDDLATLRGAVNVALGVGEFDDAKDYLHKLAAREAEAPGEAAQAKRILSILLASSGNRRQAREALKVMGLVEDGLPYRPTADESIQDLRTKAQVLALRGGRRNRRAALDALTSIIDRELATPDDHFLMAQVLERDGDWPKARAKMQLLLADSGDSPSFLAFYVRGLLRHDEARGAGPWLAKLEKLAPLSLQTVELKARLAQSEKRPEAAVKLLDDFARANPGSILQVALLLESLGQMGEAETLFRRYASQEKQPEASLPLAAYLGRRKRVVEALDLCDPAWKSGQPELASQASVAVLYASMAGEEACRRVVSHLEEAIRRVPDKVSLQFDLANVEILRGKFKEAEAIFRKIYEKDKENASSANNLAWLLAIQDGMASEALSLVDRTIELSGQLPMLLDTRATARMALGQVDAAIEDLEEATNSGPSPTRYFHLAQAYLKANKLREAREALREANVLGLDESKLHPTERNGYHQLLEKLPGQ